MSLREVRAYWALEVKTGKKVLVTPDMVLENPDYRNSIKFVRLNDPVPADTPDAVKVVKGATKRTAVRKKAAEKSKAAPPKKKAAKKKAAK